MHRRLVVASDMVRRSPPEHMQFLHSALCQIGMPRRHTDARSFIRRNGHTSILLEAGVLYDGRDWREQPLPYGAVPRLVMVYLSSEAVRTRQRSIELGASVREFLTRLGMSTSGGERGGYAALRAQMEALAACRLTIGLADCERTVTVDAKPIKRFDAWLQSDGAQQSLWPGALELSEDFFNTLAEHAVPLDHRALAALKHSSLAIDIYTWLAHRLCRLPRAGGVKLSWANLREQFGQEYRDAKDFKKAFRHVLRQVLAVYPDARVAEAIGGLVLYPSRPPLGPARLALRSTPPLHKICG